MISLTKQEHIDFETAPVTLANILKIKNMAKAFSIIPMGQSMMAIGTTIEKRASARTLIKMATSIMASGIMRSVMVKALIHLR